MTTPKKTDKNSSPQKFEVEQGADNNNIPTEDAVMADDQIDEVVPSKGISLYIDLEHDPEKEPDKNTTTKVGFVLNNKEVSLTTIAAKIAEFDKIEIAGFLDKKNYEAVKKAKSELLKTRTTLGKVAKAEVIDPINNWLKLYKSDLDEVSAALLAGQQKMEAKLKEIDDAFLLEQQRVEKEQQDRIQGRVSGLFNLGAVFNEEGFYVFPYDDTLIINSVQIKEWEEPEYQEFIDLVVVAWNADQTRKQQEEAAEEEEKLKTQALAAETIKLRRKVLRLLGGVESDGFCTMKDGQVLLNDFIAGLSGEEWEKLTDDIENPPVVDTPADHTEEYKGQTADDDLETTAEEAVASFSGEQPPIHEAYAQQTSGFEIEGNETAHADVEPELNDEVTDIEFEEAETSASVLFNHNFTSEDPFINHHFKSTSMRIFPTEFEMEANDGVAPADLLDAGILGRTELQYILIKRPK